MEAVVPKAKYDALEARFNALEHQFKQLLKLMNGAKSERFVPTVTPGQISLFEPESAEVSTSQTERISYERKKQSAKREGVRQLPDHLPVEEHVLEPAEDTTGLKCIGQEVTDTIDYQPGRLVIVRRIRPKYVKHNVCEQEGEQTSSVLIAPLPSRPIERGMAEVGLLTQLCVDKYVDHLPLDRQAKRFARDYDWKVSTSTLGDWFAAVCTLLEPLYDTLQRAVIDSDYLQVDESTIKVLDRTKKGKTHLGYQWVYRNPLNGLIFFEYRRGRGAAGVMERLANFTGYLQTDGYKAYQKFLRQHPKVTGVSCGSHIRRKFHDALDNNRRCAEHVLTQMQMLYRVEAHCRKRGRSAAERLALRRRVSKPVYAELLKWIEVERASNLSTDAYGKALRYAADQLPKLTAVFKDGRIELDNNLIENSIRPLALGRKNYMFAGSHKGAQRAAMMYSFFGTCKQLDINPREWLCDVLKRIAEYPKLQLRELLPDQWLPAN